jgi:uncharacterized protein YfdQ (DUF2303 family)
MATYTYEPPDNLPGAESIDKLVALGQATGRPVESFFLAYTVVPEGSEIKSLEDFQYPHGIPPSRIKVTPSFADSESFCAYFNDFKGADGKFDSRIFGDPVQHRFHAILDYHSGMTPSYCSHQAVFAMKLSDQWRLWMQFNDTLIPQLTFAEFLEDNRMDIVEPDAATMLEIARDLEAHTEVNFNSKINTVNGAAVLLYEENITGKVANGRVEIPERFKISIPVYFGEAEQQIGARLRFRISDGKLKFQYKLDRPAELMARAFDTAAHGIAQNTATEVLLGTI